MLDYMLTQLMDGMSLSGVLLIALPLTVLVAWFTGRRWYLRLNLLLLIFMSFPITGKMLLQPIDIGVRYEMAKTQLKAGDVDAIAVIASGAHTDPLTQSLLPSMTSFSRVMRAQILVEALEVPLIISGSDQDGQSEIPFLVSELEIDQRLLLSFGAKGTAEHAANIARQLQSEKLQRVAVFISGIHAYRTRAALQKQGVDVRMMIVGLNDSDLDWSDFVPGFEGFFYWKHALKEYMGLAIYYWKGLI